MLKIYGYGIVKMVKIFDRQGKEWVFKIFEERKNVDVFW